MKRKYLVAVLTFCMSINVIPVYAIENMTQEELATYCETLESEKDNLQSKYDELNKKYEELLAKSENLPDYDVVGTVNEVDGSTFKVTTEKGNIYKFNYSDTELNIGETVKFHYKGELSSSSDVQSGTVSNLEVTGEAPVGAEYDTGITYDDLSRNPDQFEGKKVKFTGTVVQLVEDTSSDEIQIRFAINDDYDQMLLCGYDKSIVSSRVLEDDTITIYGQSVGLISYESTLGGTITIPAVYIDKIDQ